jgi:hypothetical protein
MRKTMTALAAVVAFAAAGAVPAMACGGEVYASPCSQGLFTFQQPYEVQHESVAVERLPEPAGPQYYYVNQGPTYSGPGNWAPVPTYQERAVTGWHGYDHGYYYGYNGGPYGDATTHDYDGMPNVRGPVVYRYAPGAYAPRVYRPGYRYGYRYGYHHSLRYGYGFHRSVRYGYGPRMMPHHGYAPHFYAPHAAMHGPHMMMHAPRYAGPRPHGPYRY